jgi:hypothetical protein
MIMFSRHYRTMTYKFFVDSLFDSQSCHSFKTANNFYGVSGHDARVGPGERSLFALISTVWHSQLGYHSSVYNDEVATQSIKHIMKKQLTEALDEEVQLVRTSCIETNQESDCSTNDSEELPKTTFGLYEDENELETSSIIG